MWQPWRLPARMRGAGVTCCCMHGLSPAVPLKPDKTLSGEINSSKGRGKPLNSWHSLWGFWSSSRTVCSDSRAGSGWEGAHTPGAHTCMSKRKEKNKGRQVQLMEHRQECWWGHSLLLAASKLKGRRKKLPSEWYQKRRKISVSSHFEVLEFWMCPKIK